MKKGCDALNMVPVNFFDPAVTPINSPGFVAGKNILYQGTHNANTPLARATNTEEDPLNVGVCCPLFTFAQFAAASRSVRLRYNDFPNNLRSLSAIDAALNIMVARGEDNHFDTLMNVPAYLTYRESLLEDKIAYAENGVFLLTLPAGVRVVLSDGSSAEVSRADDVNKTLIGDCGGVCLQYITTNMAQSTLFDQKSLNSFKDSPSYTTSAQMCAIISQGRARAYTPAETAVIARLMRGKSVPAVELGVLIAAMANLAEKDEARGYCTALRSGQIALPAAGTKVSTAFPAASATVVVLMDTNEMAIRSYVGAPTTAGWAL
jgi:hypothetical protein